MIDAVWVSRHACIILATSFLSLLTPALAIAPRTLVAKIERVSDGDTVTAVTSNQTKLRLRLLGTDAPEVPHGDKPGQPFGEEARDYLDHLIGGKRVRVDAYGPDEFNRVLAVVWDEQMNINLLMVAMGYAEVYRGAPCQVYCRELEDAEAKATREQEIRDLVRNLADNTGTKGIGIIRGKDETSKRGRGNRKWFRMCS